MDKNDLISRSARLIDDEPAARWNKIGKFFCLGTSLPRFLCAQNVERSFTT